MSKKPVLIDLEHDDPVLSPAEAPLVPDAAVAEGRAMLGVVAMTARKPSRLTRLFWGLLITLLLALVSISFWEIVSSLLTKNLLLGYALTGLIAALALVCIILILRELAAFARLGRIDKLRHATEMAIAEQNLEAARGVVADLHKLYARRDDAKWGRDQLKERAGEQLDAHSLLGLAEHEVLVSLDTLAEREVEAAARQVATVTALVPLAFADVLAALLANMRMIRRIAEIYGARSGAFGTWRLARAVIAHLVATGAVAIGDDMLGSIAGGGVLSKLSRRFGEGLVNGALTARVGIATMQVCRPLPFISAKPSSVTKLVQRALTGVFTKS
ncbi:MAG: TIGR01620 family protein [Pseudomonadota bacterium]